jgi:hypothetical protein
VSRTAHASKRFAAQTEGGRVLENAGILQHVLLFVGPGCYLLAGTVNKAFHECYARVPSQTFFWHKPHTVTSGMTMMKAVFASASCVQEACDAGLQLAVHNRALYKVIGSCSKSLPALERAFQCGLMRTSSVCIGAAEVSQLDKLQWLHLEQGCPLDNEITKIAAKDGDLEMLMWARSRRCEWQADRIPNWAAQSGNVDMLDWLIHEDDIFFNAKTMRCAAVNGDLAMCQFLWDVGCDWDELVAAEACCSGNLELVQWLHDDGCHVSAGFAKRASGSCSVEMLTWLYQQGYAFVEGRCMQCAAKAGLLDNCKYLLSIGCPFTDLVCSEAALIGHFKIVRWAHQAGSPLHASDEIAQHAARLNNLEMLQYMQQQHVVWKAAQLSELLNAAGAYEHLDVAKWLRQQGAQWPAVLQHTMTYSQQTVLTHWKGETLVWARSEGCTSVLPPGEDRVIRHVHPMYA